MARIRTIKPEFWTDAALIECSLNARLLFIGTWNFADDEGNLDRSAKQIKARIFPADSVDCEPMIQELLTHGLLIEYSVNGKKYLHIHSFKKHQVINRPGKPQCPLYDDSLNTHGAVKDDSRGKGRERKGKETPDAGASEKTTDEIWGTGISVLKAAGFDEKLARSFLGKLCKDYGQILVSQAIRDCVKSHPAEPQAWLVARCQERRKKNGKFNVMQYSRESLAESLAAQAVDQGATPEVRVALPAKIPS